MIVVAAECTSGDPEAVLAACDPVEEYTDTSHVNAAELDTAWVIAGCVHHFTFAGFAASGLVCACRCPGIAWGTQL